MSDKKQRKEVHLTKETLDVLEYHAKEDRRSLKGFLENLLTAYAELNPIPEPKVSLIIPQDFSINNS